MGGYGSGEHFRSKYYRFTVEDCLKFQLGELNLSSVIDKPEAQKHFSFLDFYRNDKLFLSAKCSIQKIETKNTPEIILILENEWINRIKLVSQSTANGGHRYLMQCPDCGRKALKLFLKPPYYHNLLCRICHNLTHDSSKESKRPCKFEYILAASCGISVNAVRKSLNSLRSYRYQGNYIIENLYTKETFMKQIGLKLSEYELKELTRLSKELDLSRSELIRRALDYYINLLKSKQE